MATDPSPTPEPQDDAAPAPTVAKVPDDSLFEIVVDGTRAGLTQYVEDAGRRIFFHTEVDDAYSGQGLAGILVRDALDTTRADGLRIVAVCPYVAAFVRRHKEWDDILDHVTRHDIEVVEKAVRG